MLRTVAAMTACFAAGRAYGQSAGAPMVFEAASVRLSKSIAGQDGLIKTDPGRLVARNATLKRLIFEAWQVPYAQIIGGPGWLNTDEYDIEAKAEQAASLPQLRLMLRGLLAERFQLAVRSEKREGRVYALLVGDGGPRLHGRREGGSPLAFRFHGDLHEFAGVLAIQLTIPFTDDPSTPSLASGPPVPVVDKTGIEGTYDFTVELKPDPGGDNFTVWRRALQEQLGLKLEAQKGSVEFLVIEHAERVPTAN